MRDREEGALRNRIQRLSDEELQGMLDAPQGEYTSFAFGVAQQELSRRAANRRPDIPDSTPNVDPASESSDTRLVEQTGGPWSTIDYVTLPIFFLIGGWALLIFVAVMVAPLLLLGLTLYAPFLRHYRGSPNTRLKVCCDLCDQAAVGYKEICSTSGFLHRVNTYYARGFLCQVHTAAYVGRANLQNLGGMFLFIGGWGVLPSYFWSRAQGVVNLPILPRGVGQPGVDAHFDLVAKLCERAASSRGWSLVSEFSTRALRDDIGEDRAAQMLIYRGVSTAAQEQLGGRKSKDTHLEYLNEAEGDLAEGIRLGREHSISDKIIRLAENVLNDVQSRREIASRRWI